MNQIMNAIVLTCSLLGATTVCSQITGSYRLCDAQSGFVGHLVNGIVMDVNQTPLYEIKQVSGGILRGRDATGSPIFVAGRTPSPVEYEVFDAEDNSVGRATLTLGAWRIYDHAGRLVFQTCR